MDVEKKRSKGGFLHLFDWPSKSRKKLFANNSEPFEESKKARENDEKMSKSQPHIMDRDETRTNSTNNARSGFSCVSLVTSEEEHETKAPSVVARLMGLDSLPVPYVPEPRFNPALDPCFLESSRRYEHSDYIYLPNNLETVSWNHVESRTSKLQNRPINRFQTEMLPPKSAKPIPITHNRLLSPIRSPGFVPSKNPAYIMEAASRIIETSPRVVTKTRVSAVGSSSVPLSIRDLKEKLEAAHKTSTVGPNRHSRERQTEKRHASSSLHGTIVSRVSGKDISDSSKSKGKSPLLAAQSKSNLLKREGSASLGSSSVSRIQKEKTETRNQLSTNKPEMQRTVCKATSANTSKTVLRQNNQKQNRNDSSSSKTLIPNQQGKKITNKVVNKVVVESETGSGSKKTGHSVTGSEKDVSLSRKKILARNRKSPDRDLEKRVCDNGKIRGGEKSIKRNVTVDGDIVVNQKKGIDVISFTFSSPIKGHKCDPQSLSSWERERETDSCVGTFGASSKCSTGFNIIAGDSLSVLLEQKLRELSFKIESSGCSVIAEEITESTLKESLPLINVLSVSDGNSFNDQANDSNRKCQVVQSEEAEEQSISSISSDARKEFDQHSSPTSDLGPSCSGSCSGSRDTFTGIKQPLFVQDPKFFNWISSGESWPAEDDNTEFSESASSASMATIAFTDSEKSSNWELQYISTILNNCLPKLDQFVLGKTQNILPPGLFEQLEDRGNPMAKIEQKALFDCVSQCLEYKREQNVTGRFKGWAKEAILFDKKDWLAEELNKEILGWKNMGELMVDELVDKDMSTLIGRWIDYEREAFEEGIEIEKMILSALVDDLVYDLVVC